MAEVYGYIYLITNIQNNKKYSGKTTTENVIKYIEDHFRNAYKNYDNGTKHFYNAIRKYGRKNFKYIILGECYSEEELNESEKAVIYHYRLFSTYQNGKKHDGIYGYNLTEGGEGASGYTWDAERKQKHILNHLGQKNPTSRSRRSPQTLEKQIINGMVWGKKKKTEEHKKKIGLAQRGIPKSKQSIEKLKATIKGTRNGKNNPNYGHKASDETKRKISEARKKWWQQKRVEKYARNIA